MAKLKDYNGHYCESEYENAFLGFLEKAGWTYTCLLYTSDAILGVVSDRYRIVQNEEAFQFTDDLLRCV